MIYQVYPSASWNGYAHQRHASPRLAYCSFSFLGGECSDSEFVRTAFPAAFSAGVVLVVGVSKLEASVQHRRVL